MKRITAIFFLSVIMIFMWCIVPFSIARRAVEKLTTSDDAVNIDIDWEKLYPFEGSRDITPDEKLSVIDYVKEKIENYTSSKLTGRQAIIEAAKMYEDVIGWNMAAVQGYNPVIKLNDGYLSGLVVSRDVTENVQAVKELDDFCHSLGIEYMYINYPAKICISQDKEISGILDFTNQNADQLLHMLRESGVSVYDFRETLHNEGMNHHEAFFRTDHHWKPETGLWAARHILQILRDDYGWNVKPEILDAENFEYVVYRDWFLGSQGKKLTLSRTNPDDFTMIYPKFRTRLHFEIPTRGINTSGDFSITYEMSKVETRDYYGLSPSGAYNHGRSPVCKLNNMIADNNKKAILIYDSFSNPVIPFLALAVKNVEIVDLRQFTGSLKSYIKSSKPDVVITAYYSEMPGCTLSSQWPENKLYDFR